MTRTSRRFFCSPESIIFLLLLAPAVAGCPERPLDPRAPTP